MFLIRKAPKTWSTYIVSSPVTCAARRQRFWGWQITKSDSMGNSKDLFTVGNTRMLPYACVKLRRLPYVHNYLITFQVRQKKSHKTFCPVRCKWQNKNGIKQNKLYWLTHGRPLYSIWYSKLFAGNNIRIALGMLYSSLYVLFFSHCFKISKRKGTEMMKLLQGTWRGHRKVLEPNPNLPPSSSFSSPGIQPLH